MGGVDWKDGIAPVADADGAPEVAAELPMIEAVGKALVVDGGDGAELDAGGTAELDAGGGAELAAGGTDEIDAGGADAVAEVVWGATTEEFPGPIKGAMPLIVGSTVAPTGSDVAQFVSLSPEQTLYGGRYIWSSVTHSFWQVTSRQVRDSYSPRPRHVSLLFVGP